MGQHASKYLRNVALRGVKLYGPLCEIVKTQGRLPNVLRLLLETVPSDDLDHYFAENNGGQRLLAEICRCGQIQLVRYAIKVLRLHEPPRSQTDPHDVDLSPVCSALYADQPYPDVIEYLVESGCYVPEHAFYLWSHIDCLTPAEHFRVYSALASASDELPECNTLAEWGSPLHAEIARSFRRITFTRIRSAAKNRQLDIVHDLVEWFPPAETVAECDEIADVFELCELARHERDECPDELVYFRESLLHRKRRRRRGPSLDFVGCWRPFDSHEDIDRLEEQARRGDFAELYWQMAVVGVRQACFKSKLFELLDEVVGDSRSKEAADLKLLAIHCYDAELVSRADWKRHQFTVQFLARLLDLCVWRPCYSGLLLEIYEFAKDVFRLAGYFPDTHVRDRIMWLMTSPTCLDEALFGSGRTNNLDEALFIVALAYHPMHSEELDELILTRVLPGQSRSTFGILLRKMPSIGVELRNELAASTCCRMEVSPARIRECKFDAPHLRLTSLSCLAAGACRSAGDRRTLDENLPKSLVEMARRHPPVAAYLLLDDWC